MRDVQHLALGLFHLLQREGGFAAARAAHHDERRRRVKHGLLGVVERDGLVQQVDGVALRVQVAQRFGLALGFFWQQVGNQRLVHRGSAQKPRLLVGVVGNHLQHQRTHAAGCPHQCKQQAVGIVEAGTVKLAVGHIGQFFDLGRPEVARRNGFGDFGVTAGHGRRVQAGVFKNAHGRQGENGLWAGADGCQSGHARPQAERISRWRGWMSGPGCSSGRCPLWLRCCAAPVGCCGWRLRPRSRCGRR